LPNDSLFFFNSFFVEPSRVISLCFSQTGYRMAPRLKGQATLSNPRPPDPPKTMSFGMAAITVHPFRQFVSLVHKFPVPPLLKGSSLFSRALVFVNHTLYILSSTPRVLPHLPWKIYNRVLLSAMMIVLFYPLFSASHFHCLPPFPTSFLICLCGFSLAFPTSGPFSDVFRKIFHYQSLKFFPPPLLPLVSGVAFFIVRRIATLWRLLSPHSRP